MSYLDRQIQASGKDSKNARENKRMVTMAGLYLSGFGPRCGKAARDLFRGIYESEGHFVVKGE